MNEKKDDVLDLNTRLSSLEDPESILAKVLGCSDPNELEIDGVIVDEVIYVARPTSDCQRWTWFLQLSDHRFVHVSAICSDWPRTRSYSAPTVTICDEVIKMMRAAVPVHAVQMFSALASHCAQGGSFVGTSDKGQILLGVFRTKALPVEVQIIMVLLAADILVVSGNPGHPDLKKGQASMWFDCTHSFVCEGMSAFEPVGIEDLGDLFILWCLHKKLGPLVWCAALRRRSLLPEATERLRASGFDVEAIARWIFFVKDRSS